MENKLLQTFYVIIEVLSVYQCTLSCNTILYACAINEVSTHVDSQLDDLLYC